MTTHAEKRNMPYTAEQLFALVADVERYPEFLPWCVDCHIKKKIPSSRAEATPKELSDSLKSNKTTLCFAPMDLHISPLPEVGRDDKGGFAVGRDDMDSDYSSEIIYADLTIGYKMFREEFGSKVTLNSPNLIHVEYVSGPMKYLSNHWKFIQEDDGSCTVDFYVDFEFKNRVLQNIIGAFFTQAMQKMVVAFESRAQELYKSPDSKAY